MLMDFTQEVFAVPEQLLRQEAAWSKMLVLGSGLRDFGSGFRDQSVRMLGGLGSRV